MTEKDQAKPKIRRDLESARDDLRRMADEIRLQLHLGNMEAKDKWKELEPRLAKLEKDVEHTVTEAADDVAAEVDRVATVLSEELRELRDHLRKRL